MTALKLWQATLPNKRVKLTARVFQRSRYVVDVGGSAPQLTRDPLGRGCPRGRIQMTDKTFDLFCPQCNILVSARVIASANGGFRSENPVDPADSEYHGEHYSIALCGRCSEPFLIRESLYGVPGEFETVTEEKVLYPSDHRLPLDDAPASVTRAYDQATRAFSAGLYEPSALMCRKAIDAAAISLGAQGDSLYDRLSALRQAGHIDKRLLDWAHAIRLVGNEAAHDPHLEVSRQDARDILDFTEAILIYLFALNRRFERLRARREYPSE